MPNSNLPNGNQPQIVASGAPIHINFEQLFGTPETYEYIEALPHIDGYILGSDIVTSNKWAFYRWDGGKWENWENEQVNPPHPVDLY